MTILCNTAFKLLLKANFHLFDILTLTILLLTMKSFFFLSLILCLSLINLNAQSVIANWNFNDGFSLDNDTPQIVHNASTGSGVIYQQRADTDGNGKGGNAFDQFGITSSSGKSMAWDDVGKSGDNDAEFFITFSSAGFQNINLYFDIKGNGDAGILSYDLKYDFNNLQDANPADVSGTVKDFASGSSTSFLNNEALPTSISGVDAEFSQITLDFGSLLDNQNIVALRLDDFKENDAMSIDNVVVTGTVIPEPSTYAMLLGLFTLAFAFIKKQRKS